MAKLRKTTHTPCAVCPLGAKDIFRKLTAAEFKFVQQFKSGEILAEPGSTFLIEGHNSPSLYTVLEGWAFRYKSLEDDRRQILSFALPGDFLGIQSAVFSELQYTVEALTPLRLCTFSRSKLWDLYSGHPALCHDLMSLSARAEQMADVHLLTVGRRTAAERIGYLLLHLFNRCKALDIARGSSFDLPITQTHIADALGLSLVHTNKTLRSLMNLKLINWEVGAVEIYDEAGLRALSKYDEDDSAKRPFI